MVHVSINRKNSIAITIKKVAKDFEERVVVDVLFLYLVTVFLKEFGEIKLLYKSREKYFAWYVTPPPATGSITATDLVKLIYVYNHLVAVDTSPPRSWLIESLKNNRYLPKNTRLSLPELTAIWLTQNQTVRLVQKELTLLHDLQTGEQTDLSGRTPSIKEITPLLDTLGLPFPKNS